jgi:prepilin-type N-terminal cleavage/methylation domain-containing protein
MKQTFKRNLQKGFTLVELLIVVIILAILAAIVVPQFSSSTDDANKAAVQTNLAALRSAIELYAAQHGGLYPGATTALGAASAAGDASAYVLQLTQYTEPNGKVSTSKTSTAIYGPYIRSSTLPVDPVAKTSDITLVATGTVPLAASGSTAYTADIKTGQILAVKNPTF